jgi:glycine cleavage system pyridoxal-binding protein P
VTHPDVEREWIVRFLDDLRAAETAAAEVLAAWVAVCRLDGLRGGLRAIAERETAHAELLAERLHEMGAGCTAALDDGMRNAALTRFGSETVADEEKLAQLLARYPDDEAATRPIIGVLEHLDHDLETREILRLVAEGEGATVAWLRAYHEGLARQR